MDLDALEPELVSVCFEKLVGFGGSTTCRYDLWWPPIWGGSYWTAALQYRTLKGGAALGRRLNIMQDVVDYEQKANLVLDYMQVRLPLTAGFD